MRNWKKLLLAASLGAALALSGCGGSEIAREARPSGYGEAPENAERVVTGNGLLDDNDQFLLAYVPPEETVIRTEINGETVEWEYWYTFYRLEEIGSTDIDGGTVADVDFYYRDAAGNRLKRDTAGRFTGFQAAEGETLWKAEPDEEGLYQTAAGCGEAFGADMGQFAEWDASIGEIGGQVYLWEDKDAPFSDTAAATFDPDGRLRMLSVDYCDVVRVSEQDAAYFDQLVRDYVDTHETFSSYTVKTAYRAREGVLIAYYSVTLTDLHGGVWVESYTAGLPQ